MTDVESLSATQPFCVWTQADRHFAIRIPAEVLGSLGTESLIAFKRVPRRGLETGGILLGRTELQGDTTTFWIEGFAPIESEHRFGPSYLLSDSDFAHLQTGLSTNGTASIGIFRSQTRSEQLAVQDEDVRLFEKCFGAGENLFLMLAPLPHLGAFYFLGDGNLKCVHQFNLMSSLSSGSHGRTASAHVNLPAPAPPEGRGVHTNIARHAADHAVAPFMGSQGSDQKASPDAASTINRDMANMPPDIPPDNAGRRSSFAMYDLWTAAIHGWAIKLWNDCSGRISGVKFTGWVLAAVAVAVLTVRLLSSSFHPSAMPDHRAPDFLYLKVEQAGRDLRVLWDGSSAAVHGATRAVLHIQDGDQQSDRELASSELQAGQFTYHPQHSAVTFRLNTYAGEPKAIGLVQVMFPPSLEPVPPPVLNSQPVVAPPLKPIVRAGASAPRSIPRIQSDDKRDPNVETQLPTVRSPEASKMTPPAVREPSPPPGLEETRGHTLNAAGNDISRSGRELTVQASVTPVSSSKWGHLFGKIPLVGHLRKQGKAVEAAPVHQPRPIVRMPGNERLIGPVAVGVRVYVNESGVVKDAAVVEYGDDPMTPTLAIAALVAARNWTFAPPRIDEIPVASQMMIRFYFSP